MAFKGVEDRDLCKQLIAEGKSPKEILVQLSGRCTINDVYALRNYLKKKKGTGGGKKISQPRPSTDMPPFISALIEERDRLEARVKTLNELLDLYEGEIHLDLHEDLRK